MNSNVVVISDLATAREIEAACGLVGLSAVGVTASQAKTAVTLIGEPLMVFIDWASMPEAAAFVASLRSATSHYTYLVALADKASLAKAAAAAGVDAVSGLATAVRLLSAYRLLAERMAAFHAELEIQRQGEAAERDRLLRDGTIDALTRIANRRSFDVEIAAAVDRVARYDEAYGLAMIDIDNFKKYNDRYGHPEGDKILALVAHDMSEAVRDSDRVFRYGGEEFAILLPQQTIDKAVEAVERVRAHLEAQAYDHERNVGGIVTISAGVALLDRDSFGMVIDNPIKDWKDRADAALYAAKEAGRNRVMREAVI